MTKKTVKKKTPKRRKIVEKNRQVVQKTLMTWGPYSPFNKVDLQVLEDDNPGYDTYYVELEGDSSSCSCRYGCDCDTTKAFLYAIRKETDDEYYARIDKQKEADKEHKAKIADVERETWERLNKKFAKDA